VGGGTALPHQHSGTGREDVVFGVDRWDVSHGCRTFLPLLMEQDAAHIVNTSSMAALNGHPLGLASYTVAKFGPARLLLVSVGTKHMKTRQNLPQKQYMFSDGACSGSHPHHRKLYCGDCHVPGPPR